MGIYLVRCKGGGGLNVALTKKSVCVLVIGFFAVHWLPDDDDDDDRHPTFLVRILSKSRERLRSHNHK